MTFSTRILGARRAVATPVLARHLTINIADEHASHAEEDEIYYNVLNVHDAVGFESETAGFESETVGVESDAVGCINETVWSEERAYLIDNYRCQPGEQGGVEGCEACPFPSA